MFEQAFKSCNLHTVLDCPGGTFPGAGVKVADIDKTTFDLSVKNPDSGEEITHRSPAAIMKEIAELDQGSAQVLKSIKTLL